MKLKLVIILIVVASVARAQSFDTLNTYLQAQFDDTSLFKISTWNNDNYIRISSSIRDTTVYDLHSIRLMKTYPYDQIDIFMNGKQYYIKIKGYVEYYVDDKGIKTDCVNNR